MSSCYMCDGYIHPNQPSHSRKIDGHTVTICNHHECLLYCDKTKICNHQECLLYCDKTKTFTFIPLEAIEIDEGVANQWGGLKGIWVQYSKITKIILGGEDNNHKGHDDYLFYVNDKRVAVFSHSWPDRGGEWSPRSQLQFEFFYLIGE